MKKLYVFLLLILSPAISNGQSITITPNQVYQGTEVVLGIFATVFTFSSSDTFVSFEPSGYISLVPKVEWGGAPYVILTPVNMLANINVPINTPVGTYTVIILSNVGVVSNTIEVLEASALTTTITIDCPSEQIYGEHSEETELLRYFRDNVLSKSPEGQEIIRLYYEWSPAIIKAMEEDESFKQEVKQMIDGVLELIERE